MNVKNRTYVDQIAGGHVKVPAKRAKEIERATLGRVPAKILRPDIFDVGTWLAEVCGYEKAKKKLPMTPEQQLEEIRKKVREHKLDSIFKDVL